MVPVGRVEQFGLACLAADAAAPAGGLLGVAERLGVLPLVFGDHGEAVKAQGLAAAVAELLVQLGHVGVVLRDPLVVTRRAGVVVGAAGGDRGVVTDRGRHRRPLDRGPFKIVPPRGQVGVHGPGDLPAVVVQPRVSGEGNGGEQDVVFGLEPGQGLRVPGEPLGGGTRARRGQRDRPKGREHHGGAVAGGVQVVAQHLADRGSALGLAVGAAGLIRGVGTQQVVQHIPARDMLGDQVRAGEFGQQAARPGLSYRGQAGGRGGLMSGPGCRPSSRNIRAASALSCW